MQRVLDSGWVMQGPEVERFESSISALHGAKYAVAVSSGTAALHLCYLALNLKAGDLVYVPSFAWPSAANMALAVGATPVFVDVDPLTYNMDPRSLRDRIEWSIECAMGRPRLAVPVHQFGLAANMDEVTAVTRAFDLPIVEDAACALGTLYKGTPIGGHGEAAILSFHPRKSITTGEGGMILTNNRKLAESFRALRNHGQRRGEQHVCRFPGFNYRMTDIQAAIGCCQLAKLSGILERRRQIAEEYKRVLSSVDRIRLPHDSEEHTWQTYMIVLDTAKQTDDMLCHLQRLGIQAGHGSICGHLPTQQESFEAQGDDPCPESSMLFATGIALPLHPGMTTEDATFVAEAVRERFE